MNTGWIEEEPLYQDGKLIGHLYTEYNGGGQVVQIWADPMPDYEPPPLKVCDAYGNTITYKREK